HRALHSFPTRRSSDLHSLSLRLEELRDVVRLAEPRRMPGGSTMLEVRLVIGRPDDAPEDAREPGGEGSGPFPFPPSRFPFSPPPDRKSTRLNSSHVSI